MRLRYSSPSTKTHLQTPTLIGCELLKNFKQTRRFAPRCLAPISDQRRSGIMIDNVIIVNPHSLLFCKISLPRSQQMQTLWTMLASIGKDRAEIKTPGRLTGRLQILAWRWPTFTRESALSSALSHFTVLFGMGRSGTNSLWSSGLTGWSAEVWEDVQHTQFVELRSIPGFHQALHFESALILIAFNSDFWRTA